MKTPRSNGFKTAAVLLAFALVQVSLQLALAAPVASTFPTVSPQGVMGRITARGSQPASINGNNAVSGDSVPSGALVQTPSGTSATIDLGPLGTIDIEPGSSVRIDYVCPPEAMANPDPALCTVKVTVLTGCVVSHYKQGSHHEIFNNKQERTEQSDPNKERAGGGTLRNCADAPPAGAAATGGGIGQGGLIAILAGAAAVPVIILAAGGDDPSNSTP